MHKLALVLTMLAMSAAAADFRALGMLDVENLV